MSCLVQSFREHAELSAGEVKLLKNLEEAAVDKPKGTVLIEQGREAEKLFVMGSGWSYNDVCNLDGGRQILDINLPGDIVGMRDIACHEAHSTLTLLTDATVCAFERQQLNSLFGSSNKLVGILFLISMRREALMTERVVNLGRRDAFERFCHLIVELRARLQCVNTETIMDFRLPFSQAALADILGLTEVHVNRTLKRVRDSGLLTLANGRVSINNLDELIDASQFNPAYLHVNKSWLEIT